MIRREYEGQCRIFIPECDECGDELCEEYDFSDAVDAAKQAGWKARKVGSDWIDICPRCQEKENRREAAGDFVGR